MLLGDMIIFFVSIRVCVFDLHISVALTRPMPHEIPVTHAELSDHLSDHLVFDSKANNIIMKHNHEIFRPVLGNTCYSIHPWLLT